MPRTIARNQTLFDLFTTAMEGGIGYWAHVRSYHWRKPDGSDDLDGFNAVLVEGEAWSEAVADVRERIGESRKPRLSEVRVLLTERGEWHVVNADTIARGLGVIRRGECRLREDMRRNIGKFDRTNGNDGDPDFFDADAVVQAGVFGEIVFG